MAPSLQEQLLKAGLADKQKAQKIKTEKRKKAKQQKKHKLEQTDEARIAAEKALEAKKIKDRELNEQARLEAEKKAIAAQIRQLIEVNRQPKGNGDIACNFTDGAKVKHIYVDKTTHKHISQGKLAIVKFADSYEVVPMPVAEKIAERDADLLLFRADKVDNSNDEQADDWYAEYEIPDDLMW
ncbi:DUF2058 domain-containing protein [Lacimicrobium alkaliphilum]|uniref:Nucleoprotein/polynucleotide-associated enzyme n=1 Tax=Lacimicrobium alkaliphilum TaxID=1526571 RepID=A0ABQ1REK9_9ALTE|nr:DUF2058 domain-containing protein [Lacimicrobium alkaliphilum]GGD64463.1 hypothetical protein GCM10011357_19760 [Lacimicrobium alkaliphilum]